MNGLSKLSQLLLLVFTFITLQQVAPAQSSLKQDLVDFVKLVPKTKIGYLAAKHFILDEQFRQSLQFLRSPQFSQEWHKIRHAPATADLIAFVRTNNVSLAASQDLTAILDKLPNQLRTYRIPAQVPVTLLMQRNLLSFMREAMQALPRARFSSLMARKVAEGGDFARLYKAVQQKEFKQLLHTFQTSSQLQASWSELSKHHIEVNDVIDMAYEILSWGP